MKAKAKMQKDDRKYTGNKPIWNFWGKTKSRVVKGGAGEADKGVPKGRLIPRLDLILRQ